MHIKRIVISNFRNLHDIDIDDLPPSIVVVGENGSGKSNLLHALRLVLDPSLPETSRQLAAEDFWDGLTQPFGGAEITVTIDLVGFDADTEAKAVLGEFTIERNPYLARLTYLYRPRDDDDADNTTEAGYEAILYGGEDEGCRLGRGEWRYISMRLLPALRDAESDLQTARSPLRRLIARADVPQSVLDDVASGIDEATAALLQEPAVQAIEHAVGSRLDAMVGALFAVEPSLGIVSTRSDQLLRSLRLFIDAERRRTVAQASLGTANLLYLTLLLQDIAAQRDAGDLVELILAVEEPEAHLHPHVQRVLFRHLLGEQRALIVTTHSPHVASVTPLPSLVLLRNIGNESQAFDTRSAGLDARAERDLERYLDVTRAEILFARVVILVEGIAELYLVPAFAAACGLDLDAHGVSVCSVHGTDFAPYRRLLGKAGLDVPNVVVTDGDPDAQDVPAGLRRGRRLLGPGPLRHAVDAALDASAFEEARDSLAKRRIYVGQQTLELDLLPEAAAAMCSAHDELRQNEAARTRFKSNIELASENHKAAAAVLSAIEMLGKGRFAQRLAEHLGDADPPGYIAAALDEVRHLVGAGEDDDAGDDE